MPWSISRIQDVEVKASSVQSEGWPKLSNRAVCGERAIQTRPCPAQRGEPGPRANLAVRTCKAVCSTAQTHPFGPTLCGSQHTVRTAEGALLKCTGIPTKNHSHLLKGGSRQAEQLPLSRSGDLYCPHYPKGTSLYW